MFPNGHARPHVKLPVNGCQTQALLDTGSSHTLIDYSYYSANIPCKRPLTPPPRLLSVSGDELSVVGRTIVTLAGRLVNIVVCSDLPVPLLIGIDVLKDTILDLAQQTMSFPEGSYPITLGKGTVCDGVVGAVPKAQTPQVQAVLDKYHLVFSSKETPVVMARLPPAEIITQIDQQPIKQRGYRLPYSKRELVNQCIDEMLKDGVIQPSCSPWASPITLVPKRDGSTRFCVDYRRLNAVTQKDAHPLPHCKDVFDALHGAAVFSTLDLKSGYWQMPMSLSSIPKTAFTCLRGLFEFTRLPFGLVNAPSQFQRAMNQVLSGLIGRNCMVYIDDIVVYSKTVADHARDLEEIFERLKEVGLQLKPSKCSFELPQVELLGHVVSAEGVKPLPTKVEAIVNLAPPTSQKAVRSFLGMVGYYREHIPNYAEIALPLTELTKKNQPFVWGDEQHESFETLKQALVQAPILAHPDPAKPYTLYTDASDQAIGAILVQKDEEGVERVIAYLSHKLSGPQLRWPTIEREAYAVIYALRKFHPYLWCASFEVHTDHKPLKSLFTAEIRNTKLQRWAIQISEYGCPIKYHAGKLNIRADMLSRIASVQPDPVPQAQLLLAEVPDVWRVDGIHRDELIRAQKAEFPDEIVEAGQDDDTTPFILEGDILYSLAEPHRYAGRYPRLVLPQSFRQKVIDRCHAEVAHAAFAKTLARVQENYVWPGMRKSLRTYLAHCTRCNVLSPTNPRVLRGTLPVPPAPWHTWGMDLVGPFPRDSRGRQYLLTAVDHLTGWAEGNMDGF